MFGQLYGGFNIVEVMFGYPSAAFYIDVPSIPLIGGAS
jgi:hypothetical protein